MEGLWSAALDPDKRQARNRCDRLDRFSAFLNFSDRKESDYQDFNQEMLGRLGPFFDNIANDWPTAVRIAFVGANRGDTGVVVAPNNFGTTYPAPIRFVD